jgi:hypothetical protein
MLKKGGPLRGVGASHGDGTPDLDFACSQGPRGPEHQPNVQACTLGRVGIDLESIGRRGLFSVSGKRDKVLKNTNLRRFMRESRRLGY